MKNKIFIGFLITGFLLGTVRETAQTATVRSMTLSGHVPAQVKSATAMGALSPETVIPLSLVVQVDQPLLTQVLDRLYGPGAPANKHFLSSAEFAQAFNLADKRQKIKQFALANGLTIDATDNQDESMVVKVTGRADVIEQAFNVKFQRYRMAGGQVFRANNTDPLIPASLAPHLSAVLGLSDIKGLWQPHLRTPHASNAARAHSLSGTTGISGSGMSPTDIKKVYNLNGVSLTGAGQSVALVEFDGYLPSDITFFETSYGLPHTTITPVSIDGQANTTGIGVDEVTLDIDMVLALASGLDRIWVYEAPNSLAAGLDLYNKIATDNTAKAISSSWGLDEQDATSAIYLPESQIFQRMATQGQTIYAAAGDCGAYDQVNGLGCVTTNGFRVDDPASQPYVTGVGGTSLSGTVNSPTETTWNEFAISNGGGGGGISAVWALPTWQSTSNPAANGGSTTRRNVPDVSLNSDPDTSPYSTYILGAWVPLAGTSAAAPLWAAFTALLNQSRAALGNSSIGFINPVLYELGVSTSAATVFTDITSGDNAHYSAGNGYDNATGWGSFKGSALINSTSSGSAATVSLTPEIYVFPNPWDTRRYSQKKVTITNLPSNASVKIFTLSGFWVKTLTPQSGLAIWDLTNEAGQEVASGLYLYLVTGDGGTKFTGKIALIR